MQKNSTEFVLVEKKIEAENITSLYFLTVSKLKYEYASGQYIIAKPKSIDGHGKAYTISSTPKDKFVCITVKRKGEVSSALIDLKIGEKIILDGPYGNFYPEKNDKNIVMIAGSIGVTPFYSIIKNTLNSNNKAKITLFYSNKSIKACPFFSELNNLQKEYSNFKVVYCLTQEKTKNKLIEEYTRINPKIIKKNLISLTKKKYYICGSVSFVGDMWKMLKNMGIKEECIFTESFF